LGGLITSVESNWRIPFHSEIYTTNILQDLKETLIPLYPLIQFISLGTPAVVPSLKHHLQYGLLLGGVLLFIISGERPIIIS
jgi:hypothetical protein